MHNKIVAKIYKFYEIFIKMGYLIIVIPNLKFCNYGLKVVILKLVKIKMWPDYIRYFNFKSIDLLDPFLLRWL